MTSLREKLVILVVLLMAAIPQFAYRLNHPEKTETQLFLDFFKAYGEFFSK